MALAQPTLPAWQWLMTQSGPRRSIQRPSHNEKRMVVPPGGDATGVYNVDAKYRRFLCEAAEKLTTAGPVDVNSNGTAGPQAIVSDFYSLRNLTGFTMDPSTVPMLDNASLRSELKLHPSFASDRHERIFKSVANAMFGHWVPTALSVRRAASMGFPFNTSDMALKGKVLGFFLQNAERIMAQTLKGDLRELTSEFKIFYAYYIAKRDQPDKIEKTDRGFVSKKREVNDELYARSGGSEGRRFEADKSVEIDGNIIEGMFGLRRRTVYAAPFGMNHLLAAIMSQFRGHYLNEYAFTWKHKGSDDLTAKVQRYPYLVGVDVKQYDQSMGGWMMDWFIEQWAVTDLVKEYAKLTRKMPFAMPNPAIGDVGLFDPFFGDPWDISTFTNELGLPSGISWNPDMGKACATASLLCMIDDYTKDVVEVGVEDILKGKHPTYALLDASDDGIIMSNDQKLVDHVSSVLADKDAPAYFRFEPENGISFLGNVLSTALDGSVRFVPNILTYFRNIYVPEFGLPTDDRKNPPREFAAMGYFERKKLYKDAPFYGEAMSIADDIWKRIFDEGIDSRWDHAYRSMNLPTEFAYTPQDLEALVDPAAIYKGRFEASDLSPGVQDRILATVPYATLAPFISNLMM